MTVPTTPATPAVDRGVLLPVTVLLDDLDSFGMMHNCRYALLVERAWTMYWMGQGLVNAAERGGDAFHAVKAFTITFDAPVRTVGDYAVHFWMEHTGRTSAVAAYRLCSADGALTFAHGTRTVVRLDPGTLGPARGPDRLREIVTTLESPRSPQERPVA